MLRRTGDRRAAAGVARRAAARRGRRGRRGARGRGPTSRHARGRDRTRGRRSADVRPTPSRRSRRSGSSSGAPCGRCWRSRRPTSTPRSPASVPTRGRRHQARRHPDPGAQAWRRRRRVHAVPRRHHRARAGDRRDVVRGLPASTARARRRGARRRAGRPTAAVPGDRVQVRVRTPTERASLTPFFFDCLHVDGADLLDAPLLRAPGRAGRRGRSVGRAAARDVVVRRGAGALRLRRRRRPGGRRREVVDRTVRGRSPRRGVGQGQAAAHPRPRRARGRVGFRASSRVPVQHPPRRPRPGRRVRHAGQDVQGDDRRDAGVADRAVHGAVDATTTAGWCTVRPEQVVEIAFDGLQRSTRYPGGVALRFARVLRYRDDKTAAEADTIDTVRALAGRRERDAHADWRRPDTSTGTVAPHAGPAMERSRRDRRPRGDVSSAASRCGLADGRRRRRLVRDPRRRVPDGVLRLGAADTSYRHPAGGLLRVGGRLRPGCRQGWPVVPGSGRAARRANLDTSCRRPSPSRQAGRRGRLRDAGATVRIASSGRTCRRARAVPGVLPWLASGESSGARS